MKTGYPVVYAYRQTKSVEISVHSHDTGAKIRGTLRLESPEDARKLIKALQQALREQARGQVACVSRPDIVAHVYGGVL